MENVNSENKVVEYEIITTKKYRQVVKVQFDEKYSNELDETKITPSDLDFELGEEMYDEITHTFSTKIVNEPLETGFRSSTTKNGLITFDGETKKEVRWGNFVPKETQSVLVYKSDHNYGKNNGYKFFFLNCPTDLVEQLWRSSNFKDLSSYIITYDDYDDDDKIENILELFNKIYQKKDKRGVSIRVYELQKYVGMGNHPNDGYYYFGNSPYSDEDNFIKLNTYRC